MAYLSDHFFKCKPQKFLSDAQVFRRSEEIILIFNSTVSGCSLNCFKGISNIFDIDPALLGLYRSATLINWSSKAPVTSCPLPAPAS